jgi:5-methyltetrahydrofolate--homocysteine methyltransferase
MIIIGELINSSRNSIANAIRDQDIEAIQKVGLDQWKAGAKFIDVNAGTFDDKEPEYLKWLVQTVQEVADVSCSIDSPDPDAIESALSVHKGIPMINSISLERNRYENMIPLIAGTNLKVIALCMSDDGMPKTVDDRLRTADRLINRLLQNNLPFENIFLDPLIQPISVDTSFGIEFLNAVEKITTNYRGIHTICGLSNISYGLPARNFINRAFMIQAIAKGLDSAIMNPLNKQLMASIIAAEALIGRDSFCINYIEAYRSEMFDF